MDEVVAIGDLIRFQFRWTGKGNLAVERTRGHLRVYAGDTCLWPPEAGIGPEWTWIELLEFLAEEWPALNLAELLPLDLPFTEPQVALAVAEQKVSNLSRPAREDAEDRLESFLESHDLSRAIRGAWFPSIWIVRDGQDAWFLADGYLERMSATAMFNGLTQLGDAIADRLSGSTDLRAQHASENWASRHQRNPILLASLSTTLDSERLSRLAQGQSITDVFELPVGRLEPTELTAAARMVAALPDAVIRQVLSTLRAVPPHVSPALDALSAQAIEHLSPSQTSYDAGYALAEWFSTTLGITYDKPVDPESILNQWGVPVRLVSLDTKKIDALSCWGPRHGPAVMINTHGRHAKGWGRRATLAHEIAHLLVDRDGALPLVEVLGGRMHREVESRARAFAAELLLPRRIAGAEMASCEDPRATAKAMSRKWKVSQEILAWQARNSAFMLSDETIGYLRSKVSRPYAF